MRNGNHETFKDIYGISFFRMALHIVLWCLAFSIFGGALMAWSWSL